MRFLRHLKLTNLLKQITDPRDPKKTDHKIQIILQWVLSVDRDPCYRSGQMKSLFSKNRML